jgi:type I restriction-modification system DNA methylase subunit
VNNIEQLEDDLWAAADNLRANSKLTSSEYCMPVLGVIFLRHATNRYDAACRQIEADQAAGAMPKRRLVKGDFLKRRALQLPPEARYDTLLALPTGAHLGAGRKLVETGDVDVMISIRSNFFYTRTVPSELWHLDKGKPVERRDAVLMLDARNVYRKPSTRSSRSAAIQPMSPTC